MNKVLVWVDDVQVLRDQLPSDLPDLTVDIEQWRSTASCSRMQGILALGEKRWATIQDYKATAAWTEKMVIDESNLWFRNSQDIAFLAYLLNISDLEVDELFKAATTIKA